MSDLLRISEREHDIRVNFTYELKERPLAILVIWIKSNRAVASFAERGCMDRPSQVRHRIAVEQADLMNLVHFRELLQQVREDQPRCLSQPCRQDRTMRHDEDLDSPSHRKT